MVQKTWNSVYFVVVFCFALAFLFVCLFWFQLLTVGYKSKEIWFQVKALKNKNFLSTYGQHEKE